MPEDCLDVTCLAATSQTCPAATSQTCPAVTSQTFPALTSQTCQAVMSQVCSVVANVIHLACGSHEWAEQSCLAVFCQTLEQPLFLCKKLLERILFYFDYWMIRYR